MIIGPPPKFHGTRDNLQVLGPDVQGIVGLGDRVLRDVKPAVLDHLCTPVRKTVILAALHPDKPAGQHREPVPRSLNDGTRIGDRRRAATAGIPELLTW